MNNRARMWMRRWQNSRLSGERKTLERKERARKARGMGKRLKVRKETLRNKSQKTNEGVNTSRSTEKVAFVKEKKRE